MPIVPPRLDDRGFDDLVEELIARVPAHTPEWVDHDFGANTVTGENKERRGAHLICVLDELGLTPPICLAATGQETKAGISSASMSQTRLIRGVCCIA